MPSISSAIKMYSKEYMCDILPRIYLISIKKLKEYNLFNPFVINFFGFFQNLCMNDF